jgi:hypothetical protein
MRPAHPGGARPRQRARRDRARHDGGARARHRRGRSTSHPAAGTGALLRAQQAGGRHQYARRSRGSPQPAGVPAPGTARVPRGTSRRRHERSARAHERRRARAPSHASAVRAREGVSRLDRPAGVELPTRPSGVRSGIRTRSGERACARARARGGGIARTRRDRDSRGPVPAGAQDVRGGRPHGRRTAPFRLWTAAARSAVARHVARVVRRGSEAPG